MRSNTIRVRAMVGAVGLLLVAVLGGTALAESADRQSVGVNWHPQSGSSGPVEGASASLVRNDNGISYQFHASQLTPGNAYTLWLVVIDHPENCQGEACAGPDFVVNDAPDAQVTYAAGNVVGDDGVATFAGHQSTGPMDGWLPDRSFDNPREAEVHLVVNDHGPMLPEHMPGMIRTYRGGCSDASPFPPFFPATALADGESGPNTCLLTQSAVFVH